MRRTIASGTSNRFKALAVGLGVATVLQSSTATALITASFAGTGLIALPAALALMLGADVGTTLVAQVLSLDVRWLAPLLLVVGVVMHIAHESGRLHHTGSILLGLGLVLSSLTMIVSASQPMRSSETLLMVLAALADDRLFGLLIGAVFAWLVHSSLAMVLLVMSLAAIGAVPLGLAFALVLGGNIGAAIGPVVVTLKQAPEARRVPVGNLVMRTLGGVALLPLIDFASPWIAAISADPARQVVNFHTAFNVALAVVFLPVVDLISAAIIRLLPAQKEGSDDNAPRYLDLEALATPSIALSCAAREALRMGEVVETMLKRSIEVFAKNDEALIKEIEQMDDVVDRYHEEIKLYLTKLTESELTPDQSRRCVEILSFSANLEHVGDIVDKNVMELGSKKIKKQISFSEEGFAEIRSFHGKVLDNAQLAFGVFMMQEIELARDLVNEKSAIRVAAQAATDSHYERLRKGNPETIDSSSLHIDLIRDLKRINGHLAAVAYPILEEAGELVSSRLKKKHRRPPGAQRVA